MNRNQGHCVPFRHMAEDLEQETNHRRGDLNQNFLFSLPDTPSLRELCECLELLERLLGFAGVLLGWKLERGVHG